VDGDDDGDNGDDAPWWYSDNTRSPIRLRHWFDGEKVVGGVVNAHANCGKVLWLKLPTTQTNAVERQIFRCRIPLRFKFILSFNVIFNLKYSKSRIIAGVLKVMLII